MATNQENIVATINAKFGLSNPSITYTEALFTLFQEKGVTNTEFNGAFIEYLQLALSSSKTNINDLLAEYSQLHFDGNVSSINDLSLVVSSDNNYLFQDGTEFFFQDDTQFNFN